MDDRDKAIVYARKIIGENPIYIDTETTGLNTSAEICEISVIDHTGKAILNTLVRPACLIPPDAIKIHGITNAMVENAPGFADVWPLLRALLNNAYAIFYNASFDTRMIIQSAKAAGLTTIAYKHDCAMELYAQFWGEWNNYHQSFTWQSLENATRRHQLQVEGQVHRALYDAQITRLLVMYMAYQETEEERAK